jgi:hypothetical protein
MSRQRLQVEPGANSVQNVNPTRRKNETRGHSKTPRHGFITGEQRQKIIEHFKLKDDGGNAVGLPLNNVKQTGQKVEFGMKIAGGTFQGSLNKEGTELVGQLTTGPNIAPLTLRKK